MDFRDLPLADQLTICLRGTSLFERHLAALTDAQLDADTLLEGWTRKHLVAHVGYNAAALCRLLHWAQTGIETPMYVSAKQRANEIEQGAILAAPVLRALVERNAAQLDQAWRTLPDEAWASQIRTAQGRIVSATETVWMRTREVWVHTVDLATGVRFADFPEVVLSTLLTDIVTLWRGKQLGTALILDITDRPQIAVGSHSTPITVRATLPEVVEWAAGNRRPGGAQNAQLPTPPPWL